jgi:hypothetical protein
MVMKMICLLKLRSAATTRFITAARLKEIHLIAIAAVFIVMYRKEIEDGEYEAITLDVNIRYLLR